MVMVTTGLLSTAAAGVVPLALPAESAADPAGTIAGGNALAGFLMAGGILIITLILLNRLRRGRKRAGDAVPAAEQIAAIRARAGDRNNIDAFKADIHDFTRQMAALLDSKAERLELLIQDADERLEALANATTPHMDGRSEGRSGGREDRSGIAPENPRHDLAKPRPAADREADPGADPLHDRIYRLSDSGLDPIAIARETGQPTGQVELILALRA